jgi:glycosyltransferase involved in cell wall biosynthesis
MIAGNHDASQVLRRQGFARPIDVLPQLGVDTGRFYPQDGTPLRKQLGLSGFVAGYAGRFVPEKGLDTLIDGVAAIDGVSLLLVGAGPMLRELQVRCSRQGIETRVRTVPPVNHEQLAPYLCTMDALVLPSRTTATWKEQFGHVLIEAMACGVPVIGSDSGAIPEVIGDAGLIFPEGRSDRLAEQLAVLRDHHDIRADFAKRGVQRVAERYTQERIAAETAAIYNMALQ